MNLQELKTVKVKSAFVENHVELAYVFGSQITGRSNADSDIDIAVLLPKNMSKEKRIKHRFKLISQLSRFLGKSVDLVVFNDLNSLFFKFIITKEGQNIFRKDEEQYLDFECCLMREYYDFKPFLDLQNKLYVERSLQ